MNQQVLMSGVFPVPAVKHLCDGRLHWNCTHGMFGFGCQSSLVGQQASQLPSYLPSVFFFLTFSAQIQVSLHVWLIIQNLVTFLRGILNLGIGSELHSFFSLSENSNTVLVFVEVHNTILLAVLDFVILILRLSLTFKEHIASSRGN